MDGGVLVTIDSVIECVRRSAINETTSHKYLKALCFAGRIRKNVYKS